jgi:hypothetical protein
MRARYTMPPMPGKLDAIGWMARSSALLLFLLSAACGDDGGSGGTGGTAQGGAGGSATGGSATGGSATGGSATGGSATGGSATGGSATGGGGTGGGLDGELIFVGDFEAPGDFEPGGTYSQFSPNIDSCEHDEMCDTDSLAIVTSPVRGGERAVRMHLKDGDKQGTTGTRVELQTGSHYETTLEEDFWYGWSIHVPEEWVFDPDDMKVVHQWHTASGQPGNSPIIGLRIKGSEWLITRELDDDTAIPLWTGPVEKGVWTDWVMHIRWSPGDAGTFTAWKNGTKEYDEVAQNMATGTSDGGQYQKFGLYGSFGGRVSERTFYYDEVRVAKGPDAYLLVAP